MPAAIRLLSLGLTHWLRTQALYHALAEVMTEASPDTLVLARPARPYLCVGYHQALESVLDRAACARMGLPIVRRRVGGGATYLDANQLFYQCIFHHTRLPPLVHDVYARLLAGPVAALRALGLNAALRGENEVEVNGRRIAGIGGARIGEAAVVVGNVLFDFDYPAMAHAWRVPSEAFRRLAADALRERVTTLRAELARPLAPDDLQPILIAEFARALGRPVEPGELTPGEREALDEAEKRLVSEEWLNQHANGGHPMTALKISRGVFIRFAEAEIEGRHVRAVFRVRDGQIERAVLESEPDSHWEAAASRLVGVKSKEWQAAVRDQIAAREAL
jgi:lipoate-protein ligase A